MRSSCQSLEPRRLFAAGDPVETFGRGGTASMPYPLYNVDISDIAAAPDGKVLVAFDYQSYTATEGVPADFVRLDAAGQPDLTFGDTGLGAADSFLKSVHRIAVRRDGYFYALGSDSESQGEVSNAANWYVARFRPNGSPDRRFGDRGRVQLDLSKLVGASTTSRQNDATLDTDGRVTLLAAYRTAPHTFADAVVRFDATGARDASFHRGRPVLLDGAVDYNAEPSLAVGPDGATYVAYNRTFKSIARETVLRLTSTGGVDDTYGRDGYAVVSTRTVNTPQLSVAEDGTVFAGGAYNEDRGGPGYAHVTLMTKLTRGGQLDSSFAGNGTMSWEDQVDGTIRPLALANGGVLTIGQKDSRRWNADGSVDADFGRVGIFDRAIIKNDVIYSVVGENVQAAHLGGNDPRPFSLTNGVLSIRGTGRSDYLSIGSESSFGSSGFENVTFGTAAWTRTVSLAGITRINLSGGSGDDTISSNIFPPGNGLPKPKLVIYGGPGDDYINVYNYPATVYGESGDDHVIGNKVISTDDDGF